MSLSSEGRVWVPVFLSIDPLEAKASGGVVGEVLNRC